MSELREECYKCLSNQSCPGAAEYGSIICMTRRKYKMPRNEENEIYTHKFAIMQKQIDEKDARIKELEEQVEYDKTHIFTPQTIELNFIPKQKVRDLIENETINISGFECIAVEDLEELLEEK